MRIDFIYEMKRIQKSLQSLIVEHVWQTVTSFHYHVMSSRLDYPKSKSKNQLTSFEIDQENWKTCRDSEVIHNATFNVIYSIWSDYLIGWRSLERYFIGWDRHLSTYNWKTLLQSHLWVTNRDLNPKAHQFDDEFLAVRTIEVA